MMCDQLVEEIIAEELARRYDQAVAKKIEIEEENKNKIESIKSWLNNLTAERYKVAIQLIGLSPNDLAKKIESAEGLELVEYLKKANTLIKHFKGAKND